MKERFIKKTHYLDYQFDEHTDIKLGFTTRENGLSPYPNHSFNMARYISDSAHHITHHQDILANLIGYPRDEWVFPIQTHDKLTDDLHGIDGMYTFDSHILLTMCYADCVPVYFYSESHGYIGLAHAGWRGTYGQIVKEMLKKVDFDYEDLKIVIGPATSNSYEINDDIKNKFEELTIDSTLYIESRGKNKHGIDLKKANALLLEEAGVPSKNIYITEYSTSENLDLFFSYRVEKGQTGRMLAFIGRK